MTNVPLAVIFYDLFKVVNRRLALLVVFFTLVALGFAAHLVPWIQLPALFGEGSLCLWLLVVGVDVERWKERASAAIRMWSTPMEALA